jgi:hypothetical protein
MRHCKPGANDFKSIYLNKIGLLNASSKDGCISTLIILFKKGYMAFSLRHEKQVLPTENAVMCYFSLGGRKHKYLPVSSY